MISHYTPDAKRYRHITRNVIFKMPNTNNCQWRIMNPVMELLNCSLLQITLAIYLQCQRDNFYKRGTLLTEHTSRVGPMQHSPAAGTLFLKVTSSVLGEGGGMGGGSPWGGTVDFGD
jgi:hypothetical protein